MHPSFSDLKVNLLLDHDVSLHFVLLLAFQATFQAENNVRSTPASSTLTLVLYRRHNTHTANRYLHGSGERNGAQRKTKVSFGRTIKRKFHKRLLQLVTSFQVLLKHTDSDIMFCYEMLQIENILLNHI